MRVCGPEGLERPTEVKQGVTYGRNSWLASWLAAAARRPAMAVRPPDKDQLAVLARNLGMDLDEADLESYRALVAAGFASYDAVEELYAQVAPEAPVDREYTVPDGDENPLGAWYV